MFCERATAPPLGTGMELEGVTRQRRSVPDLGVALVDHTDGEGGEGHGVLGVPVAGGPGGGHLMQDEQHRLVVLVQEHYVLHLHIPMTPPQINTQAPPDESSVSWQTSSLCGCHLSGCTQNLG